jgi:hypothetical protein
MSVKKTRRKVTSKRGTTLYVPTTDEQGGARHHDCGHCRYRNVLNVNT